MGMPSFKNFYRTIYRTFGYPLTKRMGTPPKVLAAAEKRLGVRIPAALRDYYLVAGRERRFNTPFNRLLSPSEWEIDQRRLIFMAENQVVCWWGISTRNPDSDDPSVSRGFNDEPIDWHPEHRKCSVFLAFMVHYQAVMGGFDFIGRADVPDETRGRMEARGWTSHGEVGSMSAWSRPNQVVFFQQLGEGFARNPAIEAGGKTKRDLQSIADELGVSFE